MRTEGHAGCDFGKARIATVTGTSYTDTEVAGGREYYYSVKSLAEFIRQKQAETDAAPQGGTATADATPSEASSEASST